MFDKEKFIKDYYDAIRKRMRASGHSQTELAHMTGQTAYNNMMNKIYRGFYRVADERFMADVLGFKVDWYPKNRQLCPLSDEDIQELMDKASTEIKECMDERRNCMEKWEQASGKPNGELMARLVTAQADARAKYEHIVVLLDVIYNKEEAARQQETLHTRLQQLGVNVQSDILHFQP